MPTSLIVQLLTAFGLLACALSFWKGGAAERIGSVLILISIVFSLFGAALLPHAIFPMAQMVGDALTALGLLFLAVRYASLWLGGAMLLYAGQFTLHSFYFVTQRPNDRFHAVMNNVDFLGVILCLGVGAVSATLRRRRMRPRTAPAAPSPPVG